MYRQEHPNPQFFRNDWINLNGEWGFEFDFGASGKERNVYEKDGFDKKINVPFCPESKLSGIEYKDFMNAVWYMRKFALPSDWTKSGRIFINFGAVDYLATVYVNKKEVGTHKGGYTSFKFDITDFVTKGENTVTLYAYDNNREGRQPKGKQAHIYPSTGCDYTRTTGIWQTVWLEHTPSSYIEKFELYPDADNCKISFKVCVKGTENLEVKTSYEGRDTGKTTATGSSDVLCGEIVLSEKQLWEAGCGRLYDIEFRYGSDVVKSYFGLRSIRLDGKKFLLNGKSVFQRLVLDQGFYRDGIYTAPTDADLEKDVLISLAAGFNGARLHEKVFEPRFLYHCDKHGYLVWGEYPNWGLDCSYLSNLPAMINEWKEAVERDFNHPSIIGWCPFNETWDYNGRRQKDEFISTVYQITKAIDPTRPCIDTSGGYHTATTDIYDVHDYEQSPEEFAKRFEKLADGEVENFCNPKQVLYNGEAFFVSEYGGIQSFNDNAGWGYGNAPKSEEEFKERYKGLTEVLLNDENMMGFCYTQLYDIEQEINGLYTYDREPKSDIEFFRKVNSQPAKIE